MSQPWSRRTDLMHVIPYLRHNLPPAFGHLLQVCGPRLAFLEIRCGAPSAAVSPPCISGLGTA
eukprot:7806372-Pyramimonas_sp.AAC.1